ncbi:MAG: YlmC/YmxH family sporulation protein [Clostridiaceae bacterium]
MKDNLINYKELQHYDIINVFDGFKYNKIGDNDILIDESGGFKYLILINNKPGFNLFKKNSYIEVPWNNVDKIGRGTVVIDFDEEDLNKFNDN